jgi:hypothetical protein
METSPHEVASQLFLKEYPIGSTVSGVRLLDWVKQETNGHAIGNDLRIEDPKRRLSTIRRHLNEGARAQGLAEANRFVLAVEDARVPTFIVVAFAEHVHVTAAQSLMRSGNAAFAPLKNATRLINSVKVDELEPEKQSELEKDRADIESIRQPLAQTFAAEADRRMISGLVELGHAKDAQSARVLLEVARHAEPYRKMLNKFQ